MPSLWEGPSVSASTDYGPVDHDVPEYRQGAGGHWLGAPIPDAHVHAPAPLGKVRASSSWPVRTCASPRASRSTCSATRSEENAPSASTMRLCKLCRRAWSGLS